MPARHPSSITTSPALPINQQASNLRPPARAGSFDGATANSKMYAGNVGLREMAKLASMADIAAQSGIWASRRDG